VIIAPSHREIEGLDQKLKRDTQTTWASYTSTFLFKGENPEAINCPQHRHGHRSTMKHISTLSGTKHRTDCWPITISTGENITNIGIRNTVIHFQFQALIGSTCIGLRWNPHLRLERSLTDRLSHGRALEG